MAIRNFVPAVLLVLSATVSSAQESRATFSAGYAFSNVQETDVSANGWRINATYEVLILDSKFSHGFAVGYIGTMASASPLEYKIWSLPFYYSPRYTFGEKALKGYVKGIFGWHFSTINREGTVVRPVDRDNGLYTGLGVGGLKEINDKIAINLDYEWAFMYNSFYRNGFMNSIQLGIAYSF